MKARLLLVMLLLLPSLAFAQTYKYSVLARIPPNSSKQAATSTGFLTIDSKGNLYGAAFIGTYGAIYKVTPKGGLSTLYSFGSVPNDGLYPQGGLILDSAGNLYGLTGAGGANNDGTVFKVTPSGVETTLYSFTVASSRFHPYLSRDSAGNIYGYTLLQGNGGLANSLFKVTPGGTFSTLYTFCSLPNCADGDLPAGGPIVDKAGNIYGDTTEGGQFNLGVVYEFTTSGEYNILHNFAGGLDGDGPQDRLTQDAEGNLYGTTLAGGNDSAGTVFEVSSSGVESILQNFCITESPSCGFEPSGPVTRDSQGNLYGRVSGGGQDHAGVVYKIAADGTYTEAYYGNQQGGYNVVVDSSGNLYGVTLGQGTVNAKLYKLTKQ
jgi:uncharacterized repeat protein (TIGR03803 family)